MPHKADAAALVDECTEVARRLGAVNCVVNRDGGCWGRTPTAQASWPRWLGVPPSRPAGRRCLVIGAGGAARAVVLALADAGATRSPSSTGRPERARTAAALAGPAGRVVPPDEDARLEVVQSADLVVNATPLGWRGFRPRGRPRGWWRRSCCSRPGGRRPRLRPPPDTVAGGGRRRGGHPRRRARHARAPGRGPARAVDGCARSRSRPMWRAAEAADPLTPSRRRGADAVQAAGVAGGVDAQPARARPGPRYQCRSRSARVRASRCDGTVSNVTRMVIVEASADSYRPR